jgi:hypothetical protein
MVTGLRWQGRIVKRFRGGMGRHQPREPPIAARDNGSQGEGQDGMPGQSHDRIGASAKGQKGWVRLLSWRTALALGLSVVGLAIVGVGLFLAVSGDAVKGVRFFLCDSGFILHVPRGSTPCYFPLVRVARPRFQGQSFPLHYRFPMLDRYAFLPSYNSHLS